MANNSNFSVLDMAREMASAEDTDISDLFVKKPGSETAKVPEKEDQVETTKKKTPWVPDAEVLEGMDELTSGPVTYDKKDLVVEPNEGLKNIADDNAIQDARQAMDELSRTAANIEDAKKRHGMVLLQIPEGQYHASITAAAGDTDYKRAQKALDELFEEVKNLHPEFVLEWADPDKNKKLNKGVPDPNFQEQTGKIVEIPDSVKPKDSQPEEQAATISEDEQSSEPVVEVVINKSQLPEISWSPEEIDKIKKSRTVNLNIIEERNLDYSQIEDVDDNAVDVVLAPYQRKSNDVVAAFPASKYRATVSGLSYTEVIDLPNSNEMNDIDGERKKWSICFDHIHNQSIGPWEEYQWYKEPVTGKKIKLPYSASIPAGIDPDTVHNVTKFEDFLMKTSYMDLEFILWKILCATAMEQEIISIDCHAVNNKGTQCGNSYDWIYSPSELLLMDSIDPAVLDEIEKTANASSKEDIEKIYESSMLKTDNVVTLTTSGFKVVFGHISAYDYLTSIYAELKILEEDSEHDPTLASRGLTLTMLTSIKAFLIPQPNGKYKRISGVKNLNKVINTLDEIDWQTMSELVRIMTEPYQFRYALRDIVCPQCHNRSVIPIENMSRLLFIVARSLSSVQVVLKRT